MNHIGARTEPRGTPFVMKRSFDVELLTLSK